MASALPRLKRRADFVRVTRARNSAATPGLVLQARTRRPELDGEPPETMRVGFTASRKVGKAVARNRAKRRLRALADSLLPRHGTAGTDYVVIARAATPERAFASLRRDFVSALKRLGLYRTADDGAGTSGAAGGDRTRRARSG